MAIYKGDYPNRSVRGPRNGNPQMLVFGAFAIKCRINTSNTQKTNTPKNILNNVWLNSNIGLRVSRLSLDTPEEPFNRHLVLAIRNGLYIL